MTTSWQEELEQIRAQAARNCNLDAYPAKAIARAEDSYHLRADRRVWAGHLAEYDKTRKDHP